MGAGTKFEGAYRSGRDQARVALAGPGASLVLAAVLMLAALMPMPRPLQLGLFGLSLLNAGIAVVSLLPVYPLDGHKLAVGLLWRALGSERKARAVLHRVGRLSISLEVLGCLVLLVEEPLLGGTAFALGGAVLLQKKIGGRTASQRAAAG
jgi:Zn-dependent protease